MIIIEVTPEIRKEILAGIEDAKRVIAYEMNFSEDLRNVGLVNSYREYIARMFTALNTGLL